LALPGSPDGFIGLPIRSASAANIEFVLLSRGKVRRYGLICHAGRADVSHKLSGT
jgi:hypothetical protein